jgi:hypothetical protein
MDEQERINETEGKDFEPEAETSAELADPVGPEVKTRDSILHTYFVDSGLLRVLRNRSRRVGNFIGNEMRNLVR